jgi:hypothetical protein
VRGTEDLSALLVLLKTHNQCWVPSSLVSLQAASRLSCTCHSAHTQAENAGTAHNSSAHAEHYLLVTFGKDKAYLLMTMPSAAPRMPLKLSRPWRVSTFASMRVLVMPRESKNSRASRTSSLQCDTMQQTWQAGCYQACRSSGQPGARSWGNSRALCTASLQ